MNSSIYEMPETGVRAIFVILILFLVYSAYITGRKISTIKVNNSKYWLTCSCYIIIYSLIEGLRYMRQTDYMVYVEQYLYNTNEKDFLFSSLNSFLNYLAVPFPGAFITYSFIWITAVCFFLKEFKQYATILFPLIVIAYWYNTENFIRQYVAFSFNLISIIFIIKKKYTRFIITSIIAGLFHTIGFILAFEIIFCFFIKKPFTILISCIMYLYCKYFFDITFLNLFSSIVSSIGVDLGPIANHYLSNSDRWFSADAISDKYEHSFIAKTATTYFDLSLIIGGYYTYYKMKINKNRFLLLYNIFTLSCIMFQAVIQIEILRRFFTPFYALWSIVLVFIHKEYVLKSNKTRLLPWLISLYIYVICYLFIKFILLSKSQLFIWDIIK